MAIKWTQSDVNYLCSCFNDGLPVKEIAERLGRSYGATGVKINELYNKGILTPRGSGYKPKSVNDKSMTKESPAALPDATEQEQKKVEVPSAKDYNTEPKKSQAHWLVTYSCTACGWSIDRAFDMPYCPNCGAAMDGEEK